MSRRRLGQHFLTDIAVIRRIVDSAELRPTDRVFEIGPGKGAITYPMVDRGVPVTSLELDDDLANALMSDPPDSLKVIKGDALTVDFPELVGDGDRDSNVLVANLPYRITGALLQRIIEAGCWDRAVLMVQREVALRLAAEVGTKDYSILTVAANLRSSVEYLFSVPAGCFDPPPKVVSAVVRLRFQEDRVPVQDEKLFFQVVRAAFQQRRKMLRNSLSAVLDGQVEPILASAGIDPSLRPESVSAEGFERICRSFSAVAKSIMTRQEPIFERRIEPRWVLADRPRPEAIEAIRSELNIPNVMAKILINRGIDCVDDAREFLYPSLDHLIDPFLMIDMDKAVDRIWKAVDAGEKIMIHGDYDVDGVTGTSVLVRSIGHLGAEVTFYIPNRLEEGYGISKEAIDACGERGVTLLVSVDCGITAVAETEYARSRGVDVIITDHHQTGEMPKAVAVVNPKRPDCPYPFKELPGVALAFKLADALYRHRRLDPGPVYDNLDLVALGCAADIVPLVDENRVLVAHGLKKIEETQNPGLKALLRKLNLDGKQLGTGQLIFVLAPRINALGRMGSALEAVTMLTTEDSERAMEIADLLEEQNQLRRQVDERMYREAIEMVDDQVDLAADKAIVLWSDDWHPGVIGIVASRIAERVHLPTVLISLDGDSGKGSARSIPGFDLFGALSRCRSHLMSFGGHKYAAGLSVAKANLPAFREALLGAAGELLDLDGMTPKLEIDDEITLNQIDTKLIDILKRFGPFGPQNTRPIMVSRGVEVVGNPAIVGKNHLRFKARQNGSVFDCIGYNLGHLTYRLTPGESNLDMAYVIEENEWRGRNEIQLRLRDLR